MIENMRNYFVTHPVTKAWMFGSFARGEEREDSDVDIIGEAAYVLTLPWKEAHPELP